MADSLLGLLFEINADPSKAKEALESFQGKVEGVTAAAGGSFSGLGSLINGALGSFSLYSGSIAAVGGALFEVADRAAAAGEKIHHAGEVTGLSAAALSGLRVESKHTGESFDTLTQSLGRAGRNIELALADPTAETSQILIKAAGGAKQFAELGLLPMEDRIQSLLGRIFALNDQGERELALSLLLGRGWQTNIETLKELGEKGYAPLIQQAKDLHEFYDAKRTEEAHQFDLAWNDLKATFSGISEEIGSSLVPSFTNLFDSIAHGSPELAEMSRRAEQFQVDLEKYGVAIDLNGEIITRDEAVKRKAKQADDEWHDSSAKTVDAIKAQVAALNGALPKWAQSIHVAGEHRQATDQDTDAAKKNAEAAEKAARKLTEWLDRWAAGRVVLAEFKSNLDAIERAMKEVAKETDGERWRRFVAFMSGDYKTAGLEMPKGPAMTDPFGPLGGSAAKAVPPLHELDLSLHNIVAVIGAHGKPGSLDNSFLGLEAQIPGVAAQEGLLTTKSHELKQAFLEIVKGSNADITAYKQLNTVLGGLHDAMETFQADANGLGNVSQKAAQHIEALLTQAQKLAAAADTDDPQKMVQAQVEAGLSLIKSYKTRAIIESVYYAAKSVAAFAGGDFWQGAMYAESSALFAIAAGQSRHQAGGSNAGGSGNYGGGAGGTGGGVNAGGGYGGSFGGNPLAEQAASGSPGGSASAGSGGTVLGGATIHIVTSDRAHAQLLVRVLKVGVEHYGMSLGSTSTRTTPTVGQGSSR
jgi:ABC-type transporter Mla subunit MlaD